MFIFKKFEKNPKYRFCV